MKVSPLLEAHPDVAQLGSQSFDETVSAQQRWAFNELFGALAHSPPAAPTKAGGGLGPRPQPLLIHSPRMNASFSIPLLARSRPYGQEPPARNTRDTLLHMFQPTDWRDRMNGPLPTGLTEAQAALECLSLVDEYPEQVGALLAAQEGVLYQLSILKLSPHHEIELILQRSKALAQMGPSSAPQKSFSHVKALIAPNHQHPQLTQQIPATTPQEDVQDGAHGLLAQRLKSPNLLASLRQPLPQGLDDAQAAQQCLELVGKHPFEVSALLQAHPGVAHAAIDLLHMPHEQPEPACQLAEAILNAGYPLDKKDTGLPKGVHRLMQERQHQKAAADQLGRTKAHPSGAHMDHGPMPIQSHSRVEFSRDRFSGLLAVLAQGLKPGEASSFGVDAGTGEKVHGSLAMRVLLRKDEAGILEVSLHGEAASHELGRMRVLPEELHALSFNSLDSSNAKQRAGAPVLSMNIGNPELAQALAGRFVLADKKHQQIAFLTALQFGNLAGARACMGQVSAPTQSQEALAQAFGEAIRRGHAETLAMLAPLRKSGHLDADTLQDVLSLAVAHADEFDNTALVQALHELAQTDPRALGQALEKAFNKAEKPFDAHAVCVLFGMAKNDRSALTELLVQAFDRHCKLGESDMLRLLSTLAKDDPARLKRMMDNASDKKSLHVGSTPALLAVLYPLAKSDPQTWAPMLAQCREAVVDKWSGTSVAEIRDPSDTLIHGAVLRLLPELAKGHPPLSAQALVSMLTVGHFLKHKLALREAIQNDRKSYVAAYANAVIGLQKNADTRLRGKDAQQVLAYMRDSQKSSNPTGWLVAGDSGEYKEHVLKDAVLNRIFQEAKTELKAGC